MTTPGSPGRPGLYIPATHYQLAERMVTELNGERLQQPQGMWIGNVIHATWELGRRYGLPETAADTLDINGQDAFLPGPLPGHRWFLIAINGQATTGVSSVIIRPKDSGDTNARLTPTGTAARMILVPYPGLMLEHDEASYDGGRVGLENSGSPSDTSRELRILYYDQEM